MMAKLLRAEKRVDDEGSLAGYAISYRVGHQIRILFLSIDDVAGLPPARIRELAQQRADSDTEIPGVTHVSEIIPATEEAIREMDNLPGWGTWNADEAEAWIESNIVDLASAKRALKAIARAIVYLRDITMN